MDKNETNNYQHYQIYLILGMGKSGVSAAGLLLGAGKDVVIIDGNDNDELEKTASELRQAGAVVYTGINSPQDMPDNKDYLSGKNYDICIVSPGIPDNNLILQAVKNAGIPVISELELGAAWCNLPIIAVTGTNGKSTCVKLCGDMLEESGIKPVLAGNYGKPLCEVAMEQDVYDIAVVEVSTFQLEHIRYFRPDIAVLLNIQPDHLDRHGNMEIYKRLKIRLFDNMKDDNKALVYELNIADVREISKGNPEYKIFGTNKSADYCYNDRIIRYKSSVNGENEKVDLSGSVFANRITGLTAAAVCGVSDSLGLDKKYLLQAVKKFEPLPHRVQIIGEYDGILYIDDSKATNIAALSAALEMMTCPVHLIVGGQLKEKNINDVKTLLEEKVKCVYCIGESEEIFYHNWVDFVDCRLCGDLEGALRQIENSAAAGDVVLLSPGCASFDQFGSYRERGLFFQKLINKKYK